MQEKTVTFGRAMGEDISGRKPENNRVSQTGSAIPMQGPRETGDGTARLPAGPILENELRKFSKGGIIRAGNGANQIHLEQNAR